MNRLRSLTLLASVVVGASLSAGAGCALEGGEETSSGTSALSKRNNEHYGWWREERAARDASHAKYLTDNAADWKSYKNAPIAFSGIPTVVLKVLPIVFPEVWGDEHLTAAGFVKDPYETRHLPLGIGDAKVPLTLPLPAPFPAGMTINTAASLATLSCAGCHMGRVELEDGSIQHIPAAPSTTFSGFRGYLEKCASDTTRWNYPTIARAIGTAAATKGIGWFFGNDPASIAKALEEIAIFTATPNPANPNTFAGAILLEGVRQRIVGRRALIDGTLGAFTYGAWAVNPPSLNEATPGFLDAIGVGMTAIPGITTPEGIAGLPRKPAMIDMMSVWRQDDRTIAQWDGSIDSPLHRNLAAELGVAGTPVGLNLGNAIATTRFTAKLPAPAYPFDVDEKAAMRGKRLYGEYCASCHSPNNNTIFKDSGTDPNRANMWSSFTKTGLITLLKSACTIPTVCAVSSDEAIIRETNGYVAQPLDGIWSRAPYLHNGSVPTIAHLLTGNRPTTFYRGDVRYDQAKLGFVYNDPSRGVLFDTRKDGLSNAGHDTAAFNGDIDWTTGHHLEDLIEYLKTL